MGVQCVHHPEPPFHLPPHAIPLGHPSAPALSTLSHALNEGSLLNPRQHLLFVDFDSSHCDRREMVPHCGFDLHFSDNE